MAAKNIFRLLRRIRIIVGVLVFLFISFGIIGPVIITSCFPDGSKERACNDIKSLVTSIELFNAQNYSYPSTLEGLNSLVINPDINKYPNHYQIIKKEPTDPWGVPYYYMKTQEEFEVFSFGADRKSGGEDYDKDVFYPECFQRNESWLSKIFN